MIPKSITLTPPWEDLKVSQLEQLMVTLFSSSLRSRSGTFTGNGIDGTAVTMGFKPLFVYAQRTAAGAGNSVFAIREAGGVSFIPGSGFVSDAIKSFTPDGVTVGTNSNINSSGIQYAYIAVG